MANKDTSKGYFKKGDYPTDVQFAQVFDWLRWKDEKLSPSDVEGLQALLNALQLLVNEAVGKVASYDLQKVTEAGNATTLPIIVQGENKAVVIESDKITFANETGDPLGSSLKTADDDMGGNEWKLPNRSGEMALKNDQLDTKIIPDSNYTLSILDCGKQLVFTSNINVLLNVPNGLPIGFVCNVIQRGTGNVRVAATGESDVQILNSLGYSKTAGQYAVAGLSCIALNTFILSGDTIG